MIICAIECSCGETLGRIDAMTRAELAPQLESLLVCCHAAHPHCGHELFLVAEGNTPLMDPRGHLLRIECIEHRCSGSRVAEYHDVPRELVGCLTLVFHTAHEGHALRVTYGDRSWSSPVKGLEGPRPRQ